MVRGFACLCLLASLAGCEAVRLDIGYPGGVVGHAIEPKLPAFSQTSRVNRYLVGLAILSPLMAESVSDKDMAQQAAREINRSLASLAQLAEAAARGRPADYKSAGEYAFETLEYDVQKAYYRAAKQVALNLDLDIDLADLATANPARLLGLLSRADGLFENSRRGAAAYRDTVTIVADAVLPADAIGASQRVREYHRLRTVAGADAAGEKPVSAQYRALVKRLEEGANLMLDEPRIAGLLHHVWRACERLHDPYGVEAGCDNADFDGLRVALIALNSRRANGN